MLSVVLPDNNTRLAYQGNYVFKITTYLHPNLIIQTMKKLILLFSLIIVTACSSSSDDDSEKTNTGEDSFNPPAWLIGTWKDSSTTATYTFTKDDIITTIGGFRVSCKDQIAELKNIKAPYSIKETNTDNSYVAEFKVSSTIIYSFTKTADDKMTSDGQLSGDYKKQH